MSAQPVSLRQLRSRTAPSCLILAGLVTCHIAAPHDVNMSNNILDLVSLDNFITHPMSKYDELYAHDINQYLSASKMKLLFREELVIRSDLLQSWRVYQCDNCKSPTGWRVLTINSVWIPSCSEECSLSLAFKFISSSTSGPDDVTSELHKEPDQPAMQSGHVPTEASQN